MNSFHKLFSQYLEKSKLQGMSCFWICKTVQIPLQLIQIWYFFRNYAFLLGKTAWYWILEDFFQFCSVPSNVLKVFISKYQMNWKSQLNFRDHVWGKLFDISSFTVFLSWLALKHFILWENGGEFWNGIFCMLSPGALARWCMKPASLNYTLWKKEMQL